MESKKILSSFSFWLLPVEALLTFGSVQIQKKWSLYHWFRYIMVMPNIYSMTWIHVKPPTIWLPSLISVNKWSSQRRFRRSLIIQSCQSSLRPYISCSNCSVPETILPASLHLPFSSSNSFSFSSTLYHHRGGSYSELKPSLGFRAFFADNKPSSFTITWQGWMGRRTREKQINI